MNKKMLLFILSLFVTLYVHAQETFDQNYCRYDDNECIDEANFYAKFFTGFNFLQNTEINDNKSSYNTGYIISGSLGYYWRYGLHMEAEYAYRRNAIRKIDFNNEGSSKKGINQISSYMANLLWDLPVPSCNCLTQDIRPFIGAGAGYDFRQMHSSNSRIVFNQKWRQFSWQLIAGFAYPIYCNTEITLEYKFHQGGCHSNHHSVGVGVLYKFGL